MIKGAKLLQQALDQFDIDIEKALVEAVSDTTMAVHKAAVKSIRTQSVGKTVTKYPKGQKPYKHVVSKAGDAPNTDTGRLIGSITPLPLGKVGFVYTDLKYGLYLETVHNRPFLEPALNQEIPQFKVKMANVITRAIEKRRK